MRQTLLQQVRFKPTDPHLNEQRMIVVTGSLRSVVRASLRLSLPSRGVVSDAASFPFFMKLEARAHIFILPLSKCAICQLNSGATRIREDSQSTNVKPAFFKNGRRISKNDVNCEKTIVFCFGSSFRRFSSTSSNFRIFVENCRPLNFFS